MSPSAKTKATLAGLILCAFPGGRACGPWLPHRYLDEGGRRFLDAPEFFLELETRRLGKIFRTPFKAVRAGEPRGGTLAADRADFAEALDTKALVLVRLTSVEAKMQHQAMREFIEKARGGHDAAEPEEFASEFADYHRGALAMERGKMAEARAAWKELLARPAAERHYRSTWAAFMLGAVAEDAAEARRWFAQVRQMTAQGFADRLGLAARSLGREAAVALAAGDANDCARLCLQSVGSGDAEGAGVAWSLAKEIVGDERRLAAAAAQSPLRELVSVFVVAHTADSSNLYDPDERTDVAAVRWLEAIERAGLHDLDQADVLGWTAYSLGRFDEAARWQQRARADSGLGLWLKAKLDFRAGKIDAATRAMAAAVPKIPRDEAVTARKISVNEALPFEAAAGDLAMLRLARGEFTAALRHFLAGNFWQDAAYVAERVLTPDELTEFVQREYPRPGPLEPQFAPTRLSYLDVIEHTEKDGNEERVNPALFDPATRLRYLLARRLVRLGRFAEARPFFPRFLQPEIDRYTHALARGSEPEVSRAGRAAAFWDAAQRLREHGLELMGTEVEPDGAMWNGDHLDEDVAGERRRGFFVPDVADMPDAERGKPLPVVVPVSASERQRLARHALEPEKRYHYRYLAADLAWRAAKLMPDGQEETARVLHTAGRWLAARDDAVADRFYQALERRCATTEIGKRAVARHWFVTPDEPPSAE